MAHRILEELQNQHQQLSLFLYAFRKQIKMFNDPFQNVDIFLILDMLDFINTFPEQFHHPIEDQIFRLLLMKQIEQQDLIKSILREHGQLEVRTGRIREGFTALASRPNDSHDDLVEETLEYIDDQMEHLFHEEEDIFPLVEDNFNESDWLAVEQAIEPLESGFELDAFKAGAMEIVERLGQIDASFENPDIDPDTDIQKDI